VYPKTQLCACGARSEGGRASCSACGASFTISTDRDPVFAAGAIFGSYRLIRQIGAGGMGRVFIAEHIRLGRQVALKILRTEYSGNLEAVQRFFAEARAVNRINHENIIEISDFIENTQGPSFYVMELLKGVDLRTLQQREGMVPLPRALGIAIQMCRGLGAAHDAGIVHRDLKPDNIFLVEREGRKDLVKLLDFGVAKLMYSDPDESSPAYTTSAGIAVGTPEYMSPEQALGQPVNHLADVYATGVIMFEMISGQRPFHANSAREVMVKHMTATPVRVSRIRTYPYAIPPALDQLILHCLKKEPQDRPLSIKEVEQRLQKISLRLVDVPSPVGSTVLVPPRRRWWWAAGAALLATIAAVALVRGGRGSAASSSAPAPGPSATASPATARPIARESVRVAFDSEPRGATVARRLDARPLGVTPFSTTLEASSRPSSFEFRLQGHLAVLRELVLSKDQAVSVTLQELARPGNPNRSGGTIALPSGALPSGVPAAPSPSSSVQKRGGKRSGRGSHASDALPNSGALDHGVVLDPFE